MLLRARDFSFKFPGPVLVMGIVNTTPDSFSDGGKFLESRAAVSHALSLVDEGADILDIGGESTRPGAVPVSEAEELNRVMPVIERLVSKVNVPVSIDTMKPGVARAALKAGASFVNDVASNREDPLMWETAAEFRAGYICMHMRGNPQTMQDNPTYNDVVRDVHDFFLDRIRRLSHCGVAEEQIILDPGIGFGKTQDQNLLLLSALKQFTGIGRPILVGVSRKSFIGKLLGTDLAGRLPGALACACLAAEAGVSMVRAHEVAPTVQVLRMTEAIIAKRV